MLLTSANYPIYVYIYIPLFCLFPPIPLPHRDAFYLFIQIFPPIEMLLTIITYLLINIYLFFYRDAADEYTKGTDTMDVWFDSGTSWAGIVLTFILFWNLYLFLS